MNGGTQNNSLAVIQKCIDSFSKTCNQLVVPHPNVVFMDFHGFSSCICEESYSTTLKLSQNLKEFVQKHGNETVVKNLLVQLAHAVAHIHNHGLFHGNIAMSMVYLSETCERALLRHSGRFPETKGVVAAHQAQDIKDLGGVFDAILKMNEGKIQGYDFNVAEDLLNIMATGQVTSEDILTHPYFWDAERKLNFLSKITQFSKAGNAGFPTKKALDEQSTAVFDHVGWKDRLHITDVRELEEYNGNLKKRLEGTNKKKWVGNSTIKNFSDEINKAKGKPMYDEQKLQSLLNFIRNRWEHFWEDKLEVQACFGYDHNTGYWKFFSRRFPKLFMVVYNVAKEQIDERTEPGIKDVYFERMAENKIFSKMWRIGDGSEVK